MIRTIRRMQKRQQDQGASAVEYGLLVAAIAATIVAVVFTLGGFVAKAFQHTSDCIAQGTGQTNTNIACDQQVTGP